MMYDFEMVDWGDMVTFFPRTGAARQVMQFSITMFTREEVDTMKDTIRQAGCTIQRVGPEWGVLS